MTRLLVSVVVLCLITPTSADEQLRSSAIEGWKVIVASGTTMNATLSVETRPSKKPPLSIVYAVQEGRKKFEEPERCRLQNPDGEFELQRSGDRPWQLTRQMAIESPKAPTDYYNCIAVYLFEKTLLEMAEDPNYELIDWSRDSDGSTLCTIVDTSSEPMKPFERARLRLDTRQNYRLNSVDFQGAMAQRPVSGKIEYVYDADPFIPVSVTRTSVLGDLEAEILTTYANVSHEALPEDVFTLAHYGLAEPVRERDYSQFVIIFAAILGVGAAVFAVRYLRRK